MSKNNKYVVHEGHKPVIYYSWPEARAQVEGYSGNCHEQVQPSGEAYRKPYVVTGGRQDGVYGSWRDAHAQVSGYSGGHVEKAKSFGEAESKFQASQGSSNSAKKGYYC
ncbi:hypothetical protein AQUCO_00400275v1 [Aquilegia coerulea]|uniref:Ribonuclease H1 N-terminal domain-containing protein n=1 Tax=Aquilegia coerulea TaxID=218851 RepID=A0A2G5EU39_AQUCA|nr:hypothetical protein AQUCO_00400275v1 [Aquilegia coerulea]PIA59267.1 hypothetical protein AQUCO_00400275v1 [Aquilegia coerulea]PIA59268.1 hypothetical protein AQUCO_00400275v1 [Aquilegia coerulea]